MIPQASQLDQNTLANQYDQIRRTQGSGSARSLREAFRAGGFSDETNQDYTSGIRRAGWKDTAVAPESMPEVDTESKSLLGNRIGQYTTEGGQQQLGYYGDVDVYNRQELDPWLTKTGFSYAKGQEDPDYIKAGLDLPSLWKNPLFKTGEYDFTQKHGYNVGSVYNQGVDDYMRSLGYTHDLGRVFDLASTMALPGLSDNFTKVKDFYGKSSIPDYLKRVGYSDITNSEWKPYTGLVEGTGLAKTGGTDWWSGDLAKFAYGNQVDPNQLLRDKWLTAKGNEISASQWQDPEVLQAQQGAQNAAMFGNDYYDPYQGNYPTNTGYSYRGKNYKTQAEAEAARQRNLDQALSDPSIRSEVLAQILTTGGLQGTFAGDLANYSTPGSENRGFVSPLDSLFNFNSDNSKNGLYKDNRGRFGGDEVANRLNEEQLQQVLGYKGINYGGSELGRLFNQPEDPYSDSWSEYDKKTSKNLRRKKTTHTWDYGQTGAGLQFDNPNAFAQYGMLADGDKAFVKSGDLGKLGGANAVDYYNRDHGKEVQKEFTTLGKVGNFALNFIPYVGPVLSTLDRGNLNGGLGWKDLASTALSYVGMSGLGEGMTGLGSLADKAAMGAITGAASGGIQGGDLKSMGIGALGGAASGAVGGYLGGDAGGFLSDSGMGASLGQALGSTGKQILGDAVRSFGSNLAGNTVRGLASGQGLKADMLKSASLAGLTGGLGRAGGAALNTIFNPTNDRLQQAQYNKIASQIGTQANKIYQERDKQKKLSDIFKQRQEQQQRALSNLQRRTQPRVYG